MPEQQVLRIHGADHCPGGPDPIPCLASWSGDSFVAYDSTLGGSTQTIDTATTTAIVFDQLFISTGSAAWAIRTAVSTFRPVKAILDGWYLFFMNFEWSGAGFADVRMYELFVNNLPDNGQQSMAHHESSPFSSSINQTWGPLYCRGASLSDSYFALNVRHEEGSTQTITGVLLTGLFLGPDMDPGSFPPF